ncbi:MAG TPA: DinB family protein [Terracidiphilus sp.]|nr:DinB family protein [Terracidiphilus sp.]
MNVLTAEQAHLFVHNVVLAILKTESRTTKSILAAVPNVYLDYRPDPCAKTANELLRHIASADNFFLKSVVDGSFVPGSVKIPEDVKTPEEIVEWYGTEYAKNFDAVCNLTGEQLIKMVDFRGLWERPAYAFLQAGLFHTIHHRGQLSTYLRPMGGRVPAIYGESYDSAEAKKAVQALA